MSHGKQRGLRLRGNVWWIRYYRSGRRFEESAKTDRDPSRLLVLSCGVSMPKSPGANKRPITVVVAQFASMPASQRKQI
jgi:hypothetical protein